MDNLLFSVYDELRHLGEIIGDHEDLKQNKRTLYFKYNNREYMVTLRNGEVIFITLVV